MKAVDRLLGNLCFSAPTMVRASSQRVESHVAICAPGFSLLCVLQDGLVSVPGRLFEGSLLLGGAAQAVLGSSALSQPNIMIHPTLIAGWCGLVTTALNCLPVGSLDGGRMTQVSEHHSLRHIHTRACTHHSSFHVGQCTIWSEASARICQCMDICTCLKSNFLWKPIIEWAHVYPVIFRSLRKLHLPHIGSQTVSRCHPVVLMSRCITNAVCTAAETFMQGQAPGIVVVLMPGADPAVHGISQSPMGILLFLTLSKIVNSECQQVYH